MRSNRLFRPAIFALLGGVSVAGVAGAQTIRKSQTGTVTQRIGPAQVSVTYTRPVARGRTLFGGIVAWGRIWNPGADSATMIALSQPMTLNGETLAAGEYSMWAIPAETEPWTVIFSKATHIWHMPYPEGRDVLRMQVTPKIGEHMETLAFYFPLVDADSAVMHMHWGTTILPLALKVKN